MATPFSSAPRARRASRSPVIRAGGIVLLATVLLAGCAALSPPKPWEKGDLARPEMQFDSRPLAAKGQEHIYQSKEGAGGGYGVGGGGCGCN